MSFAIFAFPDMDVRGNLAENYLFLQGKATLKTNNISYLDSEPVEVSFSIKNFGNEALRVYPAEGELKSFQFVVTDENDEIIRVKDTIEYKDGKQKRRERIVNLVGDKVKEIILHKGESFTKKINLSELYAFKSGKKYFVTGYFYPNFNESNTVFFKTSNSIHFSVDKNIIEQREHHKTIDSDVLVDGISPEEIIFLFLGAEMKSHWKNYFKYIHFPEFVMSYTKYSKEYTNADYYTRDSVIDEFKQYLMENRNGKLSYYRILSSKLFSPDLARVVVHVEREVNQYSMKYEYHYTLKKLEEFRGIWKITNLTVKVKR